MRPVPIAGTEEQPALIVHLVPIRLVPTEVPTTEVLQGLFEEARWGRAPLATHLMRSFSSVPGLTPHTVAWDLHGPPTPPPQ